MKIWVSKKWIVDVSGIITTYNQEYLFTVVMEIEKIINIIFDDNCSVNKTNIIEKKREKIVSLMIEKIIIEEIALE